MPPPTPAELAERAKAMVDANAYMTIASADASGRPWATPVWFAHDRYTTFLWVSRPEARHSPSIPAIIPIAPVIPRIPRSPALCGPSRFSARSAHSCIRPLKRRTRKD